MYQRDGKKIIEYQQSQISLYTFVGHLDPVFGLKEVEETTIKMPAANLGHAQKRLECLIGGHGRAMAFRCVAISPYTT